MEKNINLNNNLQIQKIVNYFNSKMIYYKSNIKYGFIIPFLVNSVYSDGKELSPIIKIYFYI